MIGSKELINQIEAYEREGYSKKKAKKLILELCWKLKELVFEIEKLQKENKELKGDFWINDPKRKR